MTTIERLERLAVEFCRESHRTNGEVGAWAHAASRLQVVIEEIHALEQVSEEQILGPQLCINCRHHGATPSEPIGGMETRIDLCCRPGHWNPVVGGYYSRQALEERTSGECGMDAEFFEPKETK